MSHSVYQKAIEKIGANKGLTCTFHSHSSLSSTRKQLKLIARRIYRAGFRRCCSSCYPGCRYRYCSNVCRARRRTKVYLIIGVVRLARYALNILDPTRVNFTLTFSPSCALRIVRGEVLKKHRCCIDFHA